MHCQQSWTKISCRYSVLDKDLVNWDEYMIWQLKLSVLQLMRSTSYETSDEDSQFSFSASHQFFKTTTILANHSCLLFSKTDQLSRKHNIAWEAINSVSSEVSSDWIPFSFGVYYLLQIVSWQKSFSSNELLNSRRECNNGGRLSFSSDC